MWAGVRLPLGRDHEPRHQPLPGALHVAELRQTGLLPRRPVVVASQRADGITRMGPRPRWVDAGQIGIALALVGNHAGWRGADLGLRRCGDDQSGKQTKSERRRVEGWLFHGVEGVRREQGKQMNRSGMTQHRPAGHFTGGKFPGPINGNHVPACRLMCSDRKACRQ